MENPPVVQKPPPCPWGLSQPGLVLPLSNVEGGRGQVPGDASEMRELPTQPTFGR